MGLNPIQSQPKKERSIWGFLVLEVKYTLFLKIFSEILRYNVHHSNICPNQDGNLSAILYIKREEGGRGLVYFETRKL